MMKELLLGFLLLPIMAMSQGKQCKHCKTKCNNCKSKRDTIQLAYRDTIIVKNIPRLERKVILDSSSTVGILKEAGKTDNSASWKWILPLTLSACALWFTLRSQRRDKTYRDLAFISEIDKQLITNPELWAFWDSNKASEDYAIKELAAKDGKIINQAEPDNKEILAKRKLEDRILGFGYYKLNNFGAAMVRNHSAEVQTTWEKYMVHTILHSSRFKKILEKEKRDIIYSESIKTQLTYFLNIADEITTEIETKVPEDPIRTYSKNQFADELYLEGLEKYVEFVNTLIEEKLKEMEKNKPIYKRRQKKFKGESHLKSLFRILNP